MSLKISLSGSCDLRLEYLLRRHRLSFHISGPGTIHSPKYLIEIPMLRWFFAIFMVFNFASYVFAHGSCAASDTGVAKCEAIKNQHSVCEQSDTPSKADAPQKTDPTIHICGCVSLFVQKDVSPVLVFSGPTEFVVFDDAVLPGDFYRRIERPPIFLT